MQWQITGAPLYTTFPDYKTTLEVLDSSHCSLKLELWTLGTDHHDCNRYDQVVPDPRDAGLIC